MLDAFSIGRQNQLSLRFTYDLFTLLKIACVLGPLLTLVAYAVLAERKVSALIQDRVGPNRVNLPLIGSIPVIGPFLTKVGFWHPLVDGVKSLIKEDFTPAHVRKIYFWLAPAIALLPPETPIYVAALDPRVQVVVAQLPIADGSEFTFYSGMANIDFELQDGNTAAEVRRATDADHDRNRHAAVHPR